MVRLFQFFVLALLLMSSPVSADDGPKFGWGSFLNNDFLGDGRDRWRSGSLAINQVRFSSSDAPWPSRFGDTLEFRYRLEVITPSNLTSPAADDRRFAGALSFGVHTHFERNGWQNSVGLDLVAIGPQTGLLGLQSDFHDLIGAPIPALAGFEVENAISPTLTVETAREISLSHNLSLRPFFEVQAGIETLARAGFDLSLFSQPSESLWLRDVSSGHRYPVLRGDRQESGRFIFGADAAYVFNSQYLGAPLEVHNPRWRARLGYLQPLKNGTVFFGLTYLGKEFRSQSEGQLVGSLSLNLKF